MASLPISGPGVYITEGPFSTITSVGPQVTPAAFFGEALRGPVVPTRIESWNQYKALFGDLSNKYDLGYAVYHFFANGGRTAYVCRVTHFTGSSKATKAASTAVLGTIGSSETEVNLFNFEADNTGAWATYAAAVPSTSPEKGIKVLLTAGLRNGIPESVTGGTGTPKTFNIAVYYNGAQVESWSEVSLDPDSAQYAPTIVNNYSSYVNIVGVNSNLTAGTAYSIKTISAGVTSTLDGTAGTDGVVTSTDWTTAVDGLDTVSGSLLINLVGVSDDTRVKYALTYAENRGNAFVIIDPDKSLLTVTGSGSITALTNSYSQSSFGAVYYPMLKMPDPARSGAATLRETYPGGAIAGLYARVEQERTVAKAPAGYTYDLRGVYGLSLNFTESQVGTLYTAHVNTMKTIPGGGTIINGARTLKRTDITKYVPVRRSLNYLKDNIERITAMSVFEPNGERVWTDINTRLSRYLSDFWAVGGLKGRNSTEAFYIVCDTSNNPAYSIENGELHVEVGVALQSPAEFIVINISQFSGGTNTVVTV